MLWKYSQFLHRFLYAVGLKLLIPFTGNIVEKGWKIQFPQFCPIPLIWKYSRNTLETFWKLDFHTGEEVQFFQWFCEDNLKEKGKIQNDFASFRAGSHVRCKVSPSPSASPSPSTNTITSISTSTSTNTYDARTFSFSSSWRVCPCVVRANQSQLCGIP